MNFSKLYSIFFLLIMFFLELILFYSFKNLKSSLNSQLIFRFLLFFCKKRIINSIIIIAILNNFLTYFTILMISFALAVILVSFFYCFLIDINKLIIYFLLIFRNFENVFFVLSRDFCIKCVLRRISFFLPKKYNIYSLFSTYLSQNNR